MYPALIDSMEKQGRDLLSRAVERARNLGVNVEGLLEVGTDAAETIINVANNLNVDLIIVGSRGG